MRQDICLWSDTTQLPPLATTLRSLSDTCVRASLLHNVRQASLLSGSIRKHVVHPLRKYAFATFSHSFVMGKAPSDASRTVNLARNLIESCMSNDVFLPLGRVLDVLLDAILDLPEGSYSFIVLNRVWNDMVSILREHLFLLLVHARISDPNKEFFIDSSSVETTNLPSFISLRAAENILCAYKTTKCTLLLSGQETQLPIYPTDEFNRMFSDPVSSSLQAESAALRWRREASDRLSKVFPFNEIRDRITRLRKYLLHGEPSFWRFYFDLLRSTPFPSHASAEYRTHAEKILNRTLQTTITEYGINVPLFELQVGENGDLVPTFTLSYVESQVLASKAHVYCDLFSVTFSIRRAACELQSTFLELLSIRKQIVASRQLLKVEGLVKIVELRRRMGCFIDAYERYLQYHVLQPGFDKILHYIASTPDKRSGSKRESFFEAIVGHHEQTMDNLFAQCFVGEKRVMARVQGIVSSCLHLGEMVRKLSDVFTCSLGKETGSIWNSEDMALQIEQIEVGFERNFELLVRVLSNIERRTADSKVAVLLQQMIYNNAGHVD
ncbi:Gamma-tubulin complex component 4 [Gracilariopsis chorda]|uniref:Spindle pole body component n=1 Tax=Gracilariopsis chorda TaxID=448386 RepID=A0A2V3IGS5_9FLOR|nr:Gamma-tubulin complex component 4 [Gracilariopsis chorda]|eukprot:PXF41306.1 Gamma-tubulin complex component 4 [Gracilariopsis chorda]